MSSHNTIYVIVIIVITGYILFAFYFHNSNHVDEETTFNCIVDFIDKAKTENDFEICKGMIESYFERTKSDKLQSKLLDRLVTRMKTKAPTIKIVGHNYMEKV